MTTEKERAWDEGYAACCADAATLAHEGPFAALTPNPYREAGCEVEVTYPHDDDKCRQDSVDADGFRSLSQQIARMVQPNMGPVIVPDELSPDDGTRHYSVDSYPVPVTVVPDLPGLGEIAFNHDWSRVIRLREDGDQQVLLHETLHAILDYPLRRLLEDGTERGTIGHELINRIEVGLWESGWRRTGGESDD